MANETKPTKPGFKTTEFYLTLLAQVLGILVLFGVITPEQQSVLSDAASKIAAGIFMALSAFGYIKGRSDVKAKVAESEAKTNSN